MQSLFVSFLERRIFKYRNPDQPLTLTSILSIRNYRSFRSKFFKIQSCIFKNYLHPQKERKGLDLLHASFVINLNTLREEKKKSGFVSAFVSGERLLRAAEKEIVGPNSKRFRAAFHYPKVEFTRAKDAAGICGFQVISIDLA